MPYMRHPKHGCTSVPGDTHMIERMTKDGWELFDPTAKPVQKEPEKIVAPVVVEEAPKKRGRPRKE